MKKQLMAIAAFCAVQACAAAPLHVDGLGGGWLSSTFSYAATPSDTPAMLTFGIDAPGHAVIGPIGGADLWGKTVNLSFNMQAAMASLAASHQGDSFSESFLAQGHLDITVMDAPGLSNLLSAVVDGGMLQVDLATQRVVAEFQLSALSSGGLYLSGNPATLRLEGKLLNAASLLNCADYSYKAACLPGEQFLGSFGSDPWTAGNWSVSSDAFVGSVPEPATAALLLAGAGVIARRSRRRVAEAQA